MGYGVVNWVTKGVFLGERKIYMTAQPDDVLIPDDLWDPVTKTTPNDNTTTGYMSNPAFRYRNTGTDYTSLVAWQTAFQANPKMAAFRLEMPFNGVGYNTVGHRVPEPGVKRTGHAVACGARQSECIPLDQPHVGPYLAAMTSIRRTLTLCTPTVASITNQLTWNHEVATGRRSGNPNDPAAPRSRLPTTSRSAFIQPDISGLENPVFWEAAQNFGLQYILMDTSKPYAAFHSCPTAGCRLRFRRTPATTAAWTRSCQATRASSSSRATRPAFTTTSRPRMSGCPSTTISTVSMASCPRLRPDIVVWRQFNYAQILDRESDTLVRYMLKYHVNSWMFHAANLRAYPGGNGKSTLGDLLDAVATKYSAMYNLPVLSPSQAEIGEIMKARMAYNAAIAGGLKGTIVFGPSVTIEVTNPTGVCSDCAADRRRVGRRVLRRAADCAARGCCRRHHYRCGPGELDSVRKPTWPSPSSPARARRCKAAR